MHLINIGSDDVTFNFVWLNRLVGRWEGWGWVGEWSVVHINVMCIKMVRTQLPPPYGNVYLVLCSLWHVCEEYRLVCVSDVSVCV